MRAAIPDWEVPEQAWRPIAVGVLLPSAKDIHVLAAAIAGHADCIVTTNLKDFPASHLEPYGLSAVHPDDFIIYQWDLSQVATIRAFKAMRERRNRPQSNADDFATAVQMAGLPLTAERLREVLDLI